MIKNKDRIFEKNFNKTEKELKGFCDKFLIKGIPDEYKGIWTPKNEIRAWAIPRQSAQLLKLLVLMSKAKTVLELGTSFGYSTIWLASALYYRGGKLYTIELAKPKIRGAKQYFKKAYLEKIICQIEGNISDVLKKWNRKLDFVFMDADKMNYYSYLKKIEPHLNPGSVIVADNACDYGYLMKDYLKYVTKNSKYYSFLMKIDHGLMISVYRGCG